MGTGLILNLKKKYFDQIKAGTKKKEYRKVGPFWDRRLRSGVYQEIVIVCGYPKSWRRQPETFLVFEWDGYTLETITHEEFGDKPVAVYALSLEKPISKEGWIIR